MLRDPSLIPLSHQHHDALSLCVLTERSLRADSSEENTAMLARRVVDRFEQALANHFQVEERVLFPAVEERIEKMPLIRELIEDHRKLEQLSDALRKKPSLGSLQQFTELLRAHVRREENELFELIQRRMPRAALDLLGQEIGAEIVRVCPIGAPSGM